MKFTEAQLEQAFIDLLGEQEIPQRWRSLAAGAQKTN
jgi:hypothetical protein